MANRKLTVSLPEEIFVGAEKAIKRQYASTPILVSSEEGGEPKQIEMDLERWIAIQLVNLAQQEEVTSVTTRYQEVLAGLNK